MSRPCVRCSHAKSVHVTELGGCQFAHIDFASNGAFHSELCPCLNYVKPAPRWLVRLNERLSR